MDLDNIIKEFTSNDDHETQNEELSDQFNVNKENVIKGQLNKMPAKRIRFSILKELDPYTPDTKKEPPTSNGECENKFTELGDIKEGDQSLDLLNFDDSILEDYSDIDIAIPTKSRECDLLHNDYIMSSNKSQEAENISNISQMLNDSVEHDDVATENLIGLSPVQPIVDKRKYDMIKHHHNEEKKKWQEAEIKYMKTISDLKSEYDAKINDLLHENEESLEKMRCNHLKVLASKQVEKDEMIKLMDSLVDEMMSRDKDRIMSMIVCDQYNDTIEELIKDHDRNIENLDHDNRQMEACLGKYVQKIGKYEETIISLQKNQVILSEEIDKNKTLLAELSNNLRDREHLLSETKQNTEQELGDLKLCYEKRLLRLKVKVKHLENVECDLKSEIELRLKEKKQLEENLNELLKDE